MARIAFKPAGDAARVLTGVAKPGLEPAARAIAQAIPAHVPVHDGQMRASYSPVVQPAADSFHVHPGSPFWHWLEYGTAHNPPYRPIENAVRGLGIRYEAL